MRSIPRPPSATTTKLGSGSRHHRRSPSKARVAIAMWTALAGIALLLLSGSTANALLCELNADRFDVCLDLNGFHPDIAPSATAHFVNAKSKWESVIAGHLPPASSVGLDTKYMCSAYPATIDDVYICGRGTDLDGPGGLLGLAMVAYYRTSSQLPLVGYMEFDNADVRELGGAFEEVVLHEMGHVLGVSELFWELKGAVVDNEYVGEAGVREWQRLGCPGSPPIELDGPDGTKYSHWDEEVMRDELMTGYLNGCNPCPLSTLTVATLEDLGYEVDYRMADPYIPDCRRARKKRGRGNDVGGGVGGNGGGKNRARARARLLRAASSDPSIATKRCLSVNGLARAQRVGEERLREARVERFADEARAREKGGRGTDRVEYAADLFVDVIVEEGGNVYAVDVMAPPPASPQKEEKEKENEKK